MGFGLVYVAVGRNLKLSSKTFQRPDFIFRKGLPSTVGPRVSYSSKIEDDQKEKKNLRSEMSDGKSHVNFLMSQAKKGKITFGDFRALAERVVKEGNYQNYKQAPQSVQAVGFGGLVPMLGLPLLALLSGHSGLACAHLAYGATVLSFLGGSNWYDSISKNEVSYEKLGWCVAPQLIGWSSLLLPLPLGMLLTTFGFCLSLVHDILLASYPPWMKSLRLILTGGTVLSFFLMFIFHLLLSRRRSWSSRSRSGSSRSGRGRSKSSRSASSYIKKSRSESNSSGRRSRSRSSSENRPKNLYESGSSSSASASVSPESPKREQSPAKVVVPRYYGRNRKDSSSSLSLESSDSDSKVVSGQPSSSSGFNKSTNKRGAVDDQGSSGRSAGNARPTSKQSMKERPQEKLKKKMQALLNKQFRADKKAERERLEKAEQERQDREAELRDIAIKIRRRERYLRHRGEDEENDGEKEAMRRRERYLKRLAGEEDDEEAGDKGREERESGRRRSRSRREDSGSGASGGGRSRDGSPDAGGRRSRSRGRRSRSQSPKLGKRTLVDY